MKQPSINKLKKVADGLWSAAIKRKFNNRCIICGKTTGISSHHCIVRKAQSNATRWNLNNGVTLCYRCHIIMIHHGLFDKAWIDNYLATINELIDHDTQVGIQLLSQDRANIKRSDINLVIAGLKAIL